MYTEKEIKEGLNDHTNLDDIDLTFCTWKWLVINNKNIISKNTINHTLIGYKSSCMSKEYYETLLHKVSYELEWRLLQLSLIDTSYQPWITNLPIWILLALQGHTSTLESFIIFETSENIANGHELPSSSFYDNLGRIGHLEDAFCLFILSLKNFKHVVIWMHIHL